MNLSFKSDIDTKYFEPSNDFDPYLKEDTIYADS